MVYSKILSAAAGMLFAVTLAPSYAQDGNPEWLKELTYQLQADKNCDVMFYVRVKDENSDGQGYVEARAKCVDGREFDAIRRDPTKPFILAECGFAVCENEPNRSDKKAESAFRQSN